MEGYGIVWAFGNVETSMFVMDGVVTLHDVEREKVDVSFLHVPNWLGEVSEVSDALQCGGTAGTVDDHGLWCFPDVG